MIKNVLYVLIALLFGCGIYSNALPFAYSEITNINKEVVLEMEEIPGSDNEYFEVFSVGGQEIARRKMAMDFDIMGSGMPSLKMVSITNSIPDGMVKIYYPDGVLAQEINFKDNKKHGPAKVYDNNGKLISEADVFEDQVAIIKYFYGDGSVRMKTNGAKFTGYYEDGAVKFEFDMKNNDYKRYDEFGNASPVDEAYMKEITEEFMNDVN